MDRVVLRICDVMRRSNCAGALQYVPELTWLMFLRILDEREEQEAEAAKIVGADFRFSMSKPYRWQDWAALRHLNGSSAWNRPRGSSSTLLMAS